MEEFPSGQRGQTVNLLSSTSVVRIHPRKRKTATPDGVTVFLVEEGGFESRLLAVRRWRAATGVAFPQKSESTLLHHVGASFISFAPTFFKSQSALMPLLLLSKPDPLRWAPVWQPPCGRLSISGGPVVRSCRFSFSNSVHFPSYRTNVLYRACIIALFCGQRQCNFLLSPPRLPQKSTQKRTAVLSNSGPCS